MPHNPEPPKLPRSLGKSAGAERRLLAKLLGLKRCHTIPIFTGVVFAQRDKALLVKLYKWLCLLGNLHCCK